MVNAFLGREVVMSRIADLHEEARRAAQAREAGDRGRRPGVRAALGRRLVGMGLRLLGSPAEVLVRGGEVR